MSTPQSIPPTPPTQLPPPTRRPSPPGAAQRARAKARRDPITIILDDGDQEYVQAIRRLNRTGWADDPATLSDWQDERDELLGLLWQARQELYRHLGVGHEHRDYLTIRWLPICGPAFIALMRVLRANLYLNRTTGELRELWFEDGADLAAAMGVSRATFWRVLKRARESEAAPMLKQFLIRLGRRRYDAVAQATRKTSNQYLVAMEDPLTPDDADWVAARARELREQRRRQEHQGAAEAANAGGGGAREEQGEREGGDHRSADETLNAVADRDAERSRGMRPPRESLEETYLERGSRRSAESESIPVAPTAIGNGARYGAGCANTGTGTGSVAVEIVATETSGTVGRDDQAERDSEIEQNRKSRDEEKPRRAAPLAHLSAPISDGHAGPVGRVVSLHTGAELAPGLPTAAILSERAARVAAIEGIIAFDCGYILPELGDQNPAAATRTVAQELERAGAPEEAMCAIVQLARRQFRRHQMRGAPEPGTRIGYFIGVARGTIREARAGKRGKYAPWDIEGLERYYEANHERALARAAGRARQAQRARYGG